MRNKEMSKAAKTTYDSIRDQVDTFDLFFFWGSAPLSQFIRWGTGGPSHVALAIREEVTASVLLWEATIKEEKSGVMLSLLSDSLKGYAGKVAWRKAVMSKHVRTEALNVLPRVRKQLDGRPFETNWAEFIKAGYDGPFGKNTRDISTLFCSETVAETYQQCKMLNSLKPSNEYTPKDFAEGDDEVGQVNGSHFTLGALTFLEIGPTLPALKLGSAATGVSRPNARGLVVPTRLDLP